MKVNMTIARKAPIDGLRLSQPGALASYCRRSMRTLVGYMGTARKKVAIACGQAKKYMWRRRASSKDPEAGKPEIARPAPPSPKPGSDPYDTLGPVINNQLALLCKSFKNPQLKVELERLSMDFYCDP